MSGQLTHRRPPVADTLPRSAVRPKTRRRSQNSTPKAIVLAAGEGRSLFPLTRERPKALLPIGGQSLLERLASQLGRKGISEMVVVAGYRSDAILSTVRDLQRRTGMQVEVVENVRFSMTNTLYSLGIAGPLCAGCPILIVDGDVVCEEEVLARILESKREAVVAVDSCRVMGEEEVKVEYDGVGTVLDIGKHLLGGSAEFLGISRFSTAVARALFQSGRRILHHDGNAEYYEAAFRSLCERGFKLHALDVAGLKWTEIDFLTDYEEALRLFGSQKELSAFRSSRRERRQYLFCPGPVLVSDKVKRALGKDEIGHRETEFSELLNRVRMKLARVYGVKNFHQYTSVIITGSGSAANESVLGTAGVGKKLLILSNGEFGERLIELAERLDLRHIPLRTRWGQPLCYRDAEEAVRQEDVDAICMVHHETSTGMLNRLEPVASLVGRYKKDLYVDAVSSLGAIPVDIEAHNITFCTGSANKAIASVPGLSFVCGKRAAFDALKTVKASSMYLDLYRHFVANDQQYQTPNTPAVNLFFALESALDGVLNGGLQHSFDKYQALAAQLRKGLIALGYHFFLPEEWLSPVLTTVDLPPGFSAQEFHDRLKSLGYITYPGKGILRERVFQVANIGELTPQHVAAFLSALAKVRQ